VEFGRSFGKKREDCFARIFGSEVDGLRQAFHVESFIERRRVGIREHSFRHCERQRRTGGQAVCPIVYESVNFVYG